MNFFRISKCSLEVLSLDGAHMLLNAEPVAWEVKLEVIVAMLDVLILGIMEQF